MTRSGRLLVLAVLLLIGVGRPVPAEARTVWLCRPGLAHNPCAASLSTTRVSPAGKVLGTVTPTPVKHPKIDCFYVYPTVSEQSRANATLRIEAAERGIARVQAARFSQVCRVFAPMYRQQTLAGLAASPVISPAGVALAYRGVRDGFHRYLARYNHGRGFVLIGHSQGSEMLRRLITNEVERRPAVLRRMVSAILPGGNVEVKTGSDSGGDFQNVPGCHAPAQLHCVVAYSTFDAAVPDGAVYGRVGGPFDPGDPAQLDVLCTNPAALGGGAAPLDAIFPGATPGLPELIGLPHPAVATRWYELDGAYRGSCSAADAAHVLQVSPVGGAPLLAPVPDVTWGLHVADVNLVLGNLLTLLDRETAAYSARK